LLFDPENEEQLSFLKHALRLPADLSALTQRSVVLVALGFPGHAQCALRRFGLFQRQSLAQLIARRETHIFESDLFSKLAFYIARRCVLTSPRTGRTLSCRRRLQELGLYVS
jgi:hypothetical protein